MFGAWLLASNVCISYGSKQLLPLHFSTCHCATVNLQLTLSVQESQWLEIWQGLRCPQLREAVCTTGKEVAGPALPLMQISQMANVDTGASPGGDLGGGS